MKRSVPALLLVVFGLDSVEPAQAGAGAPADKATYDGALARRLGANENGIRTYVLVILRRPQAGAGGQGAIRVRDNFYSKCRTRPCHRERTDPAPAKGLDWPW